MSSMFSWARIGTPAATVPTTGNATGPGSPGNREGPRLKSLFLQKTFPLNRRNVVLHGRRINPEVLPDFPHRRGVLMLGDVVVNEIQNGLLFFRESMPGLIPEHLYGSQATSKRRFLECTRTQREVSD